MTRRKIFMLLGATTLGGCQLLPAARGPDAGAAAQALPALAQELVNAVPADPAVWERYMSGQGVFVSETGDVATRAELLEAFGPFPPGLTGSIAVENAKVTEFGEVAVLVFDARERQTVFDQEIEVDYKVSQTWRREDGRWRLLAVHNAVLPRDPPALATNPRRLKDYVGVYELGGQWRYRVELRDGKLHGGRDGAPVLAPLIPVGDNVFADAGSPLGILRIFERGPDGKVKRMVQRRKFADTRWIRLRSR